MNRTEYVASSYIYEGFGCGSIRAAAASGNGSAHYPETAPAIGEESAFSSSNLGEAGMPTNIRRGGGRKPGVAAVARPGASHAGERVKVGDFLKDLRKQYGYSLRQVVEMSGGLLDKTTISRVEKNTRMPSLRAVYAFSKIYKVKMEEITELALERPRLHASTPFALSANEKDLLVRYRGLSRKNRELFEGLLTSVGRSENDNAEKARLMLGKKLEG